MELWKFLDCLLIISLLSVYSLMGNWCTFHGTDSMNGFVIGPFDVLLQELAIIVCFIMAPIHYSNLSSRKCHTLPEARVEAGTES